jgi:hypothetical protein
MPAREMLVRLLGVAGGLAVFATGVALASTGEPAHGALSGLLVLLGAVGVASQGWGAAGHGPRGPGHDIYRPLPFRRACRVR